MFETVGNLFATVLIGALFIIVGTPFLGILSALTVSFLSGGMSAEVCDAIGLAAFILASIGAVLLAAKR